MSARPLFSIIIPVYNGAAVLESCLNSIASQRCTDFEVLVQDGQSSDATADIVRGEQRLVLLWESSTDEGVYDAMNRAMKRAKGKYFIFLGADDGFSSPESLELLTKTISDRSPDMVSGAVRYTDRENSLVPTVHAPGFGSSLRWRNRIHHQGTAYHRNLFEQGGYDLKYGTLADYHFNLKCWKQLKADCVLLEHEIAVADARGLSKTFRWKLYREELRMKSTMLSFVEMIPQYPWVLLKYIAKSLAQRT